FRRVLFRSWSCRRRRGSWPSAARPGARTAPTPACTCGGSPTAPAPTPPRRAPTAPRTEASAAQRHPHQGVVVAHVVVVDRRGRVQADQPVAGGGDAFVPGLQLPAQFRARL